MENFVIKNRWLIYGRSVGAMKSDIKATDKQLREARSQFEKTWAREM